MPRFGVERLDLGCGQMVSHLLRHKLASVVRADASGALIGQEGLAERVDDRAAALDPSVDAGDEPAIVFVDDVGLAHLSAVFQGVPYEVVASDMVCVFGHHVHA